MKNKLVKLIVLLLFSIIVFGLFSIYSEYKLNYINVLVSNQIIYPKTKLSEEMFYTIKIPNHNIYENYVKDFSEISNKFSSITQIINKDEIINYNFIDNSNIYDKDSFLLLNNEQTLYTLPIDILDSFGNSINLYQNVDLYGEIELDDHSIIIDLLLSNIRVLDIKDHSGVDINNNNSTKIPYLINIAIDNQYIPLLMNLEKIGKIKIFINDTTYDIKKESSLNENSLLLNYLDINKTSLKPSVVTTK